MGLEIVNITDRGDFHRLQLTRSPGGFGDIKIAKSTGVIALTGLGAGLYETIWTNIESVAILVFRIVVNITVASGVGGTTLELGSDATGAGMSGQISIDELDTTGTGWFDSCYGPATTVRPTLYMDEAGGTTPYLTALWNGVNTTTEGNAWIFYVPLA